MEPSFCPRGEYPRPQFVRPQWINLNGEWSYTFDFSCSGRDRQLEKSHGFADKIQVPFAPESELSGVGFKDFIPSIFYHRTLVVPAAWRGKRILLHFGAVDAVCEAFVDAVSVGTHTGGTVGFTFDITGSVRFGEAMDLVVHALDDVRGGLHAAGKQSVLCDSYGCSYTRTTGIWQTVWLEAVAPTGLEKVRIVADFDDGSLVFTPRFRAVKPGQSWSVEVKTPEGAAVGSARGAAQNAVPVRVELRERHPWSPADPYLYAVTYRVFSAGGEELDTVESYAGLRKISVDGDRILLNNERIFLRLVLDQGFYPTGVWTAPDDEALKRDIELAQAAGFNGARLHQKVFEERFHYWADRLGYLTWAESSSWGLEHRNPAARANFLIEWSEIVARDLNHPSIIAWTPLNESTASTDETLPGYFRPGEWAEYRRWVSALYDWTRELDGTRPVNDSSGWTHVKTDLWTVHPYRQNAEELLQAVFPADFPVMAHAPEHERRAYTGQPYVIDEFGGFAYIPAQEYSEKAWGYYNCRIADGDTLCERISEQVAALIDDPRIAGYCYTQLTDVEQEQNGVYQYDRTPKAAAEKLHAAFHGRFSREKR